MMLQYLRIFRGIHLPLIIQKDCSMMKKCSFTAAVLLIAGVLTAKPVYENKFENLPDGIKSISGVNGKAVVTTNFTDKKMLEALKTEKGTITFWFKADGYDTESSKQNIYLFMANATPGWCHLFRYQDIGRKSGYSGKLVFYSGDPRNRGYGVAATPKAISINDKRWQFVAVTYDENNCILYLNGKLVAKSKVPRPMSGRITSAKLGGSLKPLIATAFDELKIFDKVLTEDRIYSIYESERPKQFSEVESITVSGMKSVPSKLDGVISDGEYGSTAGVMFDISNGSRLAPEQSEVNLSYDDKFLYVGVKTPGNNLTADGQSAEACWDDSIEIHLRTPLKDRFQWIINAKNTIYSSRNGNKNWKAEGFSSVSKCDKKTWIMEAKIPFAALGIKTVDKSDGWAINVCRSFSEPSLHFSALGPSKGSYAAGVIPMKFKKELAPYRIVLDGDIYNGKLKSSISKNVKIEFINADGSSSATIPEKASSGEIRISADAYKAAVQIFALKPGNFKFLYLFTDIAEKKLHVSNSQPMPLFNGKPACGKLYLQDSSGKITASVDFVGKSVEYENVISIKNLKPGNYKLCIDINDHTGKKLWEYRNDYRIYADGKTPWHDNTDGISSKVPFPYIPLKIRGNEIDVVCRTYKFSSDSILPSQIISRNQKVLSAPVNITGRVNGTPCVLQGSNLQITAIDDTRCTLKAAGKLGPLPIKMSGTMEFDGFLWITLEFMPGKNKYTVEDMAINIPMSKNCSDLRNFSDYRLQRTGTVPQGRSSKNLLTESPIFWLGGNDAGLQFVMEKLEGFHLANPAESLIVERQGDMTSAQINIFDTAVKLDKPRKIEFGLEATPIRDVNPKARNIRMWANLRMNFNQLFNLYNYPDTSILNKERKAELDNYQKNQPNTIVAPYMALCAASPHTMEYRYFGDTWRLTPAPKGWDRKLPNRPDLMSQQSLYSAHYLICPSNDYINFYMSKMVKAYKELNLRGWYTDWADIRWCDNALHGHGWTDWNGQRRPSWNFRNVRELTRRIYTFMKSIDKDSVFMIHSSGTPSAAGHGFCDIFVDGENLASLVGNNMNYHQCLPLDTFRAGCNNYTWGWTNLFLPQYLRVAGLYYPQQVAFYKSPAAQKIYNHLIGMILVNDSLMHNCFGPSMVQVHAKLDKYFGWDEKVRWIPYWRINEVAKFNAPGGDASVVSVFEREGKYLFIAFNNTDKALDFVLEPAKEIKGWGNAVSFINVMTDKNTAPSNGKLTFNVPERDFVIMVAK